jgi:small GTP-binding protein
MSLMNRSKINTLDQLFHRSIYRRMSQPPLMRLNPPDEATISYKFIIIGCTGVGKTALHKRLVDDSFSESLEQTVGVEFDSTVLIVDDRKVRLQIWDTAGQEKFRSITKAYYRTAAGVLIVFDVTGRKSFDQLTSWVNDVRTLCEPAAMSTLVGSKSDLAEERVVTILEAEAFAEHHHMAYIETSAKTGENVKDAFTRTVAALQARVETAPRALGARSALMGSLSGAASNEAEHSCC